MGYLLRGALVVTGGRDYAAPLQADVLVKDGRIQAVGKGLAIPGEEPVEVIDLTGKAVVPGLINAHTHCYANLVRGMGHGLPLEPWMFYAMLVGNFSMDELRLSALLQVIESVRTGSTAFVDHLGREYAGLDTVLATYAATGVRATVAPMISDRRYDQGLPVRDGDLTADEAEEFSRAKPRPAEEILAECEDLIRKWQGYGGVLGVMVGPSGPQRCSDRLLEGAAELCRKYGVGYHTHILETRIQAEIGRYLYGKPVVEHLRDLGVLSPRASLAHSVWLAESEIEIIAEYGASVVHNPVSNLTLGSGIAPLQRLRRAGVNVALGTDGSNCGGSQAVWQSLRMAAILPRILDPEYREWPTAAEVFRMAVAGGARIIGQEASLGEIAAGKVADLVAINLDQTIYRPLESLVDQMVYGETGQGVEMVMVAGRFVLRDGKMTTVDEETVLAEAGKVAASISAKRDLWMARVAKQYRGVERLYRNHWLGK
ncbi:MAG: amidohydrolase [Firmicutes bacterium]|nr:amidohydrolase [Bacillota bacterium]